MSHLIKNGYIVTMNAARDIHDGGYVLIGDDGRIAEVGDAGKLPSAGEHIVTDAKGMMVLPGLINMHQHHWYNLFKGLAGGMLLEAWVENLLLPCARHLTAADLRAAAYLSAMEMIRTGTTCCLNHSVTTTMADEVAATIEPMAEIGMRQVFAKDFRCRTSANPKHPHDPEAEADYISVLLDKWQGAHNGLVRMALAIESTAHWIAAGMSTEDLIEVGYRFARDRNLKITNHTSGGTLAHETGYLHAVRKNGRTDVMHLMQMGVLDSHWLMIHGINVTDTDIKLMRDAGCHAVYTPTSESIRGGGVGPWTKLLRAGINCSLGTDGPMVDYSVDMVEQMKAACIIQNTANLDPGALSVERALEMATINGARALGLDSEIGSLDAGKRADIAIFDTTGPHLHVVHKPISNFVTCGRGADAHTVIINGNIVFQDRRFSRGPSPKEVIAEATTRGRDVAAKAGVLGRAKMQWPKPAAA